MKTQIKTFSLLLFFVIMLFGCEEESVRITELDGYVKLTTDKTSYQKKDTILLTLDNNSGFDLNTGMRCKQWLEMSYQENVNGKWSENKLFQYMYLRCLTAIDTIPAKTTASYKIPCDFFDSEATFQLLVPCHVAKKDTNITAVSNKFEIVP